MEILHWKTPVWYHKNIPIDANSQKLNRVNSELKLSNVLFWQHSEQLILDASADAAEDIYENFFVMRLNFSLRSAAMCCRSSRHW